VLIHIHIFSSYNHPTTRITPMNAARIRDNSICPE
jgi:hypothetical protein